MNFGVAWSYVPRCSVGVHPRCAHGVHHREGGAAISGVWGAVHLVELTKAVRFHKEKGTLIVEARGGRDQEADISTI